MLTYTLDDVTTEQLEHVLAAAAREHPQAITVEQAIGYPDQPTYRVVTVGVSVCGVLAIQRVLDPQPAIEQLAATGANRDAS